MTVDPTHAVTAPTLRCDAQIRPFPHQLELRCLLDVHLPADVQHQAVLENYAYPGSRTTITWLDSDRRCSHGEWIECPQRGCGLPAGHRGDHV